AGALRHLLRSVPWIPGRRRRHGRAPRRTGARQSAFGPRPSRAARIYFSGHHKGLRRDGRLRRPDPRRKGPVGDRRLRSGFGAEPGRDCGSGSRRRTAQIGASSAMTPSYTPSSELLHDVSRWQNTALVAGLALLAASIIGAFFNPNEFFQSYLLGFLLWLGLALGSMALVMLQYLTGGAWGVVTRRPLESASKTLPLLAVLFIPVLLAIPRLYNWSHADRAAQDPILAHRAPYMNTPFFVARAIAYFAIWILFAYFLNKWSRRGDEIGDQHVPLGRLAAPGLIVYVFTITFAAVDWAESLQDHWYSTMWGFLFV